MSIRSYQLYTGDGVQTDWAVPFQYLEQEHVICRTDGQPVEFEWINPGAVRIDPPVAPGVALRVARSTPTQPLTTFSNTNNLTADAINYAQLQALFVAEEAVDRAFDALSLNTANLWDFVGARGVNAADPIDPQDVVTRNWAENGMTSQLNLAEQAAINAEAAEDGAVAAAGTATARLNEATAAANKAEKWANENEDVEVEAGKYSAYHWSQKAYLNSVGVHVHPIEDVTGLQAALDGKADATGGIINNPALPARLRQHTQNGGDISDWNDVTETGFYSANGAANSPEPGFWVIGYVVSHNVNWVTQTLWAFEFNSDSNTRTWRREKNNTGGWTAWQRVPVTEAEFNTLYVQLANVASPGEYRSNAANKVISPNAAWSAAASVSLSDGATITPNFASGVNFTVTLGGNRTLANPTNQKAGQAGVIAITQDGTGSRTLSFGSNWKFPGGSVPALSSAAGAKDLLYYFVEAGGTVHASLVKDSK